MRKLVGRASIFLKGVSLCYLSLTAIFLGQSMLLAQSRALKTVIPFSGTASGGKLTLALTPRINADFVAITTTQGEPDVEVVRRLASAVNSSHVFKERCGGAIARSSGLELPGIPMWGMFILGGTEKGLGIPHPPTSLSAAYDPAKDQVTLTWCNPPGGYDTVVVACNGFYLNRRNGNVTSFVQPLAASTRRVDQADVDYCVVGYRQGVPSNAAAVHLSGNSWQELISLPFSSGLAPNWHSWSNRVDRAEFCLSEGTKKDVNREASFYETPEQKPLYQRIVASGTRFECGTWRQVLGLQPGAKYKVSVRVNTFGLQPSEQWAFSVHAAHNGQAGRALIPAQLAGLAPLPDGSQGRNAGRLLEYGPSKTTAGKWVLHSTDREATDRAIGDIVLPEGVNTFTIWTRLRGENASLKEGVGVDWIAVERVR